MLVRAYPPAPVTAAHGAQLGGLRTFCSFEMLSCCFSPGVSLGCRCVSRVPLTVGRG